MKKGQKSGEDDKKLWHAVTQSVKSYGARSSVPEPSKPRPPTPVRSQPLSAPAVPGKEALSFDLGTESDLRRGKFAVDRHIDLHGMTQAEAHAALGKFIAACEKSGKRTLLVITGKGRSGEGVLRRLLPLWLEEAPLKARVLAFSPARPEHGGSGAFYLRLRKKK